MYNFTLNIEKKKTNFSSKVIKKYIYIRPETVQKMIRKYYLKIQVKPLFTIYQKAYLVLKKIYIKVCVCINTQLNKIFKIKQKRIINL